MDHALAAQSSVSVSLLCFFCAIPVAPSSLTVDKFGSVYSVSYGQDGLTATVIDRQGIGRPHHDMTPFFPDIIMFRSLPFDPVPKVVG
jgi:hypothetical protein